MSVKRHRLLGARRKSGATGKDPTHSHLPREALEELARFESSGIRVERVDCRSVIDAVCNAHGQGVAEHGGPFRSALTVADLVVRTDERILKRILEQLTAHALEGHASVRIVGVRRVSKGRESVDICVSDKGPGLPVNASSGAHAQALAASPTEASSDQLQLCRRLAQLIQARITKGFDPEQGRTFTLTLPDLSKI